jgi:phage tail-like protein
MHRHVRRPLLIGIVASGVMLAAAVPAAAQQEPSTFSRWAITIDGTEFMSFPELESISSSVQLPEGTKGVGSIEAEGLVRLRRPKTRSLDLWAWHEAALNGGPRAAKDIALIGYAPDGTAVARYHLTDAWPAKYEIGALKAGASEVLMETVTMVCESIQRVSP